MDKEIEELVADGADVIPTESFLHLVERGSINGYDGIGYFHDGVKETNVEVYCYPRYISRYIDVYPYVCWYGK